MEYTRQTITATATVAAVYAAAADAETLGEHRDHATICLSDASRLRLSQSLAKAASMLTLLMRRHPALDIGIFRAGIIEALPVILIDDERLSTTYLSAVATMLRAVATSIDAATRPKPKPLDIAAALAAEKP